MTRRFRMIVSGGCALAAALLCLAYGQRAQQEAERARTEAIERYGGEVVSLVVATEGIEAGEVVERTNVAERDWLADLAPVDAVTSLDEVLGAEVSVPVAAGVPLTELNFRDATDAVEVPSDRVAVSVGVSDDLGLPLGTRAGDVLAAYAVSADGVRLIADDVQVLALAQGGSALASSGSLTMAVCPDDVAVVLAASADRTLRLALPGEGALELSETAPTAPDEVAAEPAAPDESGQAEGETATGEGDEAA